MPENDLSAPARIGSPELRRAVLDTARGPSHDELMELSDDDVERLRELAERAEPATGLRQDRVLDALVVRAPDAKTALVLRQVLDDTRRPWVLRATAAINLARIPSAASAEALLMHVNDVDPAVAQRALQSLGKIGDVKTLAALEDMDPPSRPPAHRQWEFSRRLIRHRLGQPTTGPPVMRGTNWGPDTSVRSSPLPLERLDPERVGTDVDGLGDQVFDLELFAEWGYGVVQDSLELNVLLVEPLPTAAGVGRLVEVPTVAAVVAMWEKRTSRPVVDHLVLTEPNGHDVLVTGFRLDGTQLYEGSASVQGERVRFDVASVERDGSCRFHLDGALDGEGISGRGQTRRRDVRPTTTPTVP